MFKTEKEMQEKIIEEVEVIIKFFNFTAKDCSNLFGVSIQQVAKYRTKKDKIPMFRLWGFLDSCNISFSAFFQKIELNIKHKKEK